jgi:prephenate dehydratase
MTEKFIAYQGAPGANSDMACRKVQPDFTPLPCETFDETFAMVQDGRADLAMIPIENSSAGRVADIHHLLPASGLHIVGEHFQPISYQLLAPKGSDFGTIKEVHSHVQALSQCRNYLMNKGLRPVVHADTAGAARDVAAAADPTKAAIAPPLAGEIYGLEVLDNEIHDLAHNTTRFVIMARDPVDIEPEDGRVVTSFVFRVRSVPAALYKAMGGFATNGVNITKLESYILDGKFTVAQFYADVEGHPHERPLRLALEELSFFSREVKILGVYPAAAQREEWSKP